MTLTQNAMVKEANWIMIIRKVDALDEMFTHRQAQKSASLETLQESGQLAEEYLYLETSGWHFYSYLKIRPHLIEDTSAYDDRRLMSIYKNYTYAADMAARKALSKCQILEHQGNVIHFFFPEADFGKVIYPFAKSLAALVEDHVLGYFEKDVVSFNMATEQGKSVIVESSSPTAKESERSTVSLGPCANNPAKRMIKRIEGRICPLSWRDNPDDEEWHVCECHVEEEDRERAVIMESFAMDSLYSKFDKVEGVGNMKVLGEQLEVEKRKLRNGEVRSREALYFRADMDGFTRKVKEAFDNNKVAELVEEFISYMKLANAWQIRSKVVTVSPHPWAGDCFNVEIVSTSSELYKFVAVRRNEPQGIVRDWEQYVKSDKFSRFSYRNDKAPVRWVYSIAGGRILDFVVKTDSREFKLCVGSPVGRTHAAVNFEENEPEYLVMHIDDISLLPQSEQQSFHRYDDKKHQRFKFQTAAKRDRTDGNAAQHAARRAESATVEGVSLFASRPWTY